MSKKHKPKHEDTKAPQEQELNKKGSPPDVASVRAKSQAHGKVTADKWNQ
jgi:hypothetical protein